MIKILIIFTLFICSCSESASNKETGLSNKDSAIIKHRIDSMSGMNKIDSTEQMRAYGEVFFGMTNKEVQKINSFQFMKKIGRYDFYFHELYNDNDSLYCLTINSNSRTANYYNNEVLDTYKTLRSSIVEKYGDPLVYNPFPSFTELSPNKAIYSAIWKLGDKIIRLGVKEREYTYEIYCEIYHEPMYTRQINSQYQKSLLNESKNEF